MDKSNKKQWELPVLIFISSNQVTAPTKYLKSHHEKSIIPSGTYRGVPKGSIVGKGTGYDVIRYVHS